MDVRKLLTISALFTLLLTACKAEVAPIDNGDSSGTGDEVEDKDGSGNNEEDETSSVTLKLAMVAMEDNGESGEMIGCGDSIVFVNKTVSGDLDEEREVIESALTELFAVQDPFYGESGLYNGLTHSSNLVVDEVEVEDNSVRVDITGSLISAGTCDDPRIKEQILSTIEENTDLSVTDADVFINGESLQDYFDMR